MFFCEFYPSLSCTRTVCNAECRKHPDHQHPTKEEQCQNSASTGQEQSATQKQAAAQSATGIHGIKIMSNVANQTPYLRHHRGRKTPKILPGANYDQSAVQLLSMLPSTAVYSSHRRTSKRMFTQQHNNTDMDMPGGMHDRTKSGIIYQRGAAVLTIPPGAGFVIISPGAGFGIITADLSRHLQGR